MKRKIKITESQMRKIIDRISEGEYPMDEATEMNVTQYDFKKPGDLEQFNKDVKVADGPDVSVGQDFAQIKSESTKDLFKRFLNKK